MKTLKFGDLLIPNNWKFSKYLRAKRFEDFGAPKADLLLEAVGNLSSLELASRPSNAFEIKFNNVDIKKSVM